MDTIGNLLTQIKNGSSVRKKEITVAYSKLALAILEIFKKQGIVSDFKELKKEDKKYPTGILVTIRYKKDDMSFQDLKRVSKPGRRIYVQGKDIYKLLRGRTDLVISTSKGLMSAYEAKSKGLGGEVICEVK